jgi:hypothetical protein
MKNVLFDDYHLPEDDNHHSHRRGNLKSYNVLFLKRKLYSFHRSRDSIVGIATGYGLDRGTEFRVPVGQEFSLLHVVQTGPGTNPTSYLIGTGVSFPRGGKAAGP